MRPKSPRIFIGLALILGVAGFFILRSFQKPTPTDVIVASGTIEADETIISPKVAGRLAKLFVDEGDDVKKGELLAMIDDTELSEQLGQAVAAKRAAQARLDEAINGNRPQQIAEAEASLAVVESNASGSKKVFDVARQVFEGPIDLRTQLDAAKAKLDASNAAVRQAAAALRLVRQGTRSQQIDQARAAVGQANVALRNAELDFQRMRYLLAEGAIAQKQLDDARASRDSARKESDQAMAHLQDFLAGPRPAEIREAEMALKQAEANRAGAITGLADAEKAYRDRLSQRQELVSARAGFNASQAQVAQAKAALDLMKAGSRVEEISNLKALRNQAISAADYARTLVADTRLYAPADGVVKTKSSLTGENLNPGTPVVTLADLDHIWIRVFVPEDQYGKLNLGQSVDVSADSFPNQKFQGKIVSIASDAEFTPKNAQTPEERVKLVFGVKITVGNPGRKLRPGMPGDASIHIR